MQGRVPGTRLRHAEAAAVRGVGREVATDEREPPPAEASGTDLVRWWLRQLTHILLPDAAIAELALAFDCARYSELQARSCTCTDASGLPARPARSAPSASDASSSMACIADSVGVSADPLADNHASDAAIDAKLNP